MTSSERIYLLTHCHTTLVECSKLDRDHRPYALQSRLETIQQQIMEELESSNPTGAKVTPTKPTTNDDTPF